MSLLMSCLIFATIEVRLTSASHPSCSTRGQTMATVEQRVEATLCLILRWHRVRASQLCNHVTQQLEAMALDLERCSPYKLAVGILIGYFIGRDKDTLQAESGDAWAKGAGRGLTPVHYRILSSVISDQLKAVDRAEEKSLGQLQREIRDAFSTSHGQGPAMARRVALRLSAVRYPDDLVDLVTWLGALMEETQSDDDEQQGNQNFGDRPRRLQPNSVFGVFIRRLVAGCDGGSFRRLSTLYEEMVRYVGGAVREPESSSNGGASDDDDDSDMEMDLDSPTNLTGGGGGGGGGSGPVGGFSMAGLRDLGLGERQERGGVVGVGSGTGHINAFVKQRQLQKGRQARAGGSPADERSSPAAVGVDVSGGDLSFEDDFEDDRRDGNRDDGVGGGDQGADVGQVSLSVAPSTAPAAWQLRLHLQNTVLQLEKGLSSQVPFEVVEAEVQAALKAHSDMPMAHFMRLVNCLHHRELQGSLDSLHRYFDYTVRRGGPSAATAEGFPDIARGAQGGSGRHNPQHASLALASLHFQFGHLQLASVALDEAIRVAQQSGDKVCVAQALGWLYQILAAQGHPRAGDVLRRCASQAADLGLTHLATATALLLAKEAAVARNGSNLAAGFSHSAHPGGGLHTLGGSAGGAGPSGSPAPSSANGSLASGAPSTSAVSLRRGGPAGFTSPVRIWECLEAASCGNVRSILDSEGVGSGTSDGIAGAAVGGAGANNGRGFVEVAGGTGGEGAGALACQRLLVEAAAFERFGYSEMAVACSRTVLQVFAKFASASDVEVATACVINAILRGKCLTGDGFMKAPEDIPPSVDTRQRGTGGSSFEERSRASSQPQQLSGGVGARSGADLGGLEGKEACVYEVALALALRQHEAFPHPVSNLWAGGVMVLLHDWMVNRGELTAAEGLGMSLRGCCPLSRGAEAFVEAHLQRVRLLRAQGRWQEAVRAASALAKLSDTRGLAPQYARLLLELSRARLGAEPSSPVGALPHALRCLAVCESYSLDAIHASAMIHLAEVHLRLGSTRRARILLRACLGHLLVNASVQTQGEAWLAMARCEVAEFSLAAGNGDPDREGGGRQSGFGGDGRRGGKVGDGDVRDEGKGEAPESGQGGGLRRAVGCLDQAIGLFKRCHDFAGLRECWCLKARVCAELALQGGGDVADEALRERDEAAEALLAVLEAGARALSAPSPGLRIGPAEVLKYSTRAMSQVPWVR